MYNSLRLKRACWVWLSTMWMATTCAAQATLAGDLSSIPPAAVAVCAVLAMIGGAAYTAQKIANPETVIKNIFAEVVKDVTASLVAGLVTFFVASWLGLPTVLQAACITVAGYGGSRVLERYLANGLKQIDRLGGKSEGTP